MLRSGDRGLNGGSAALQHLGGGAAASSAAVPAGPAASDHEELHRGMELELQRRPVLAALGESLEARAKKAAESKNLNSNNNNHKK